MRNVIGHIALRSPSGDILPAQPIWSEEDEDEQTEQAVSSVLLPQLAEYYRKCMEGVAPSGD